MLRSLQNSVGRPVTRPEAVLGHSRSTVTAKADSVHVRAAESGDYEAVLDIVPDLYGGADYMPHTYHSYLSDPRAHPYLCEVDRVVASFGMHYVVDQGETAIFAAARTMKQYEGCGLNSRVRTASLRAALQHHPHLHTEAYVVVDSEWYSQYRKPNSRNFTIVHETYLLQYMTTQRAVLQLLEHLDSTVTKAAVVMDTDAAVTTLPDLLLQSCIFEDPRLMTPNSYLGLKVNRENLAWLCSVTDVVATSTSTSTSTGPETVCTAVSFAFFQQVKRGPSLIVFFYGKTIQDLLTHLKAHLDHRKRDFSSDGSADLEIGFPLGISVEEIKKAVFPFLGENDIYDSLPRETTFVIERPIPASVRSKLQQEQAEADTSP